ncbi:hypothetical protein [uncultured Microbacterium sp.]|uniref:Archaeal/vacuolar-type H+-ATPase subunit A n=1 Tax=uncultured Microbacterium sp. TaxID=191216 RepID=A0A1Y5P7T4_9MICO|nr:hypothetical protein [uncultured Microbacterium sp.]SBS72141.1 Archaeal/vacuolar-type H+-ATPase subunit A [uncultured Microbacterium sp.]
MSTTRTSGPQPTLDERTARRPHAGAWRGVWLSALGVAITAVVAWGLLLFAWMIDETHFDRPSAEFDAFTTQIERLPGVALVETERWVEAPAFWTPTSLLSAVVDVTALPGLLRTACSTVYAEPVTWSLRVSTAADAEVSMHATSDATGEALGDARCLVFGYDAVGLVHELDRAAPGLAIQPLVLENETLAFVALDEEPSGGFSRLLPLVEHCADLVAAAGLDPNTPVEISSPDLGVVLTPDESGEYLALLTQLAGDHAVRSFWSSPADSQMDGSATIQVVAPEDQRTAIENAIRASGVESADAPVGFIEP